MFFAFYLNLPVLFQCVCHASQYLKEPDESHSNKHLEVQQEPVCREQLTYDESQNYHVIYNGDVKSLAKPETA